MLFTNEDKTFYGSFMLTLDREKVLGKQKLDHLFLLRTLSKSYNYAYSQHKMGVPGYYQKVKNLQLKINKLKRCEKICNYQIRLLLSPCQNT